MARDGRVRQELNETDHLFSKFARFTNLFFLFAFWRLREYVFGEQRCLQN